MAVFQGTFHSYALSKRTNVDVIIPSDVDVWLKDGNIQYNRPAKTLYLLHGFSDCSKDWLFKTNILQLSEKYNLAVVLPNGDNSFYLDRDGTGFAYCRFIGEELPNFMEKTFHLSRKKEDMFIGGASMGGFGAAHTALTYPEQYSKALLFSPAAIINDLAHFSQSDEGMIANYEYYTTVFGDLTKLKDSVVDPEHLIRQLQEMKKPPVPFYITVGKDDFLIEKIHELRDFLTKANYPFLYQEGEGNHDWYYWDRHLEEAIRWMLDCTKSEQ